MAGTLLDTFLARAARQPDRPAFRTLRLAGGDADAVVTWGEWRALSAAFAGALADAGHAPGEAVAILGGSRPVWPIADVGALLGGYVSVGLYPTASATQVEQILADCGATAAVADTAEQLAKVLAVRDRLPALRTIVCADPGALPSGVLRWDRFLASGTPERAAAAEQRAAGARPDDVALLIYTSGSTGEPKGARITHRYLLASAESIQGALGTVESDTTLSFLPFCHAGERIFGLYSRIHVGMEALLVPDVSRVWDAAAAYAPTLFGGLPRFYEKVYEQLRAEEAAATGEEATRWATVLELGRRRSRLRRAGGRLPEELEQLWRREGAPLFERVRALFGGRMRLATSGGAKLPDDVAEVLDALGLTILGAYGLTEHLCAAFNRPHAYTFDSVGPAMPGTEVRIAPDGEVLIRRSALTFAGYHRRPRETADAFAQDDAGVEWLLTGDLGTLDERGFLRITGRKKELIALSTGKKVAPLPIEARLVENPLISQAVLYGEGRKYVAALLAPRRAVVEAWAREQGLALTYAQLLVHPVVRARIQEAVDEVNGTLSRTESVRRFALLQRELSVEADELTPTLKVRRPIVAEKYRDLIEELYR